ncbi:helix-turn-helix transcriptional regulator [Mannheimia sp. AT1]|uniref:Helix-turn-helix transcriptional regulator n=1 Tax=Mannheimia cairinae TaxID=3025936 RepID=A0ABT5ML27_9PAST|nr:helix-turn-helix transcriptional regulator [Mannheimia cairinae]MDD0822897.1 helix-turn-helix transcriptional regulator [Mannheimia cairinae]MDD0826075.1 helix-turn-helix transcriptional regulator [Mannheimia cairinae]
MNPKLTPYITTADMLVETFGKHCEVVLHDLATPENSVVYVAGNVTHRQVGQNFDHLVTQVIMSDRLKNDFVANYYFESQGKLIRSSTQLIFDEDAQPEHKLIGALCINIDTSPITTQIAYLNEFLPNLHPAQSQASDEELPLSALMNRLIESILGSDLPQALSRDEKIEKVRFMEEKGVFLMKGGIDKVAEKLKVNKVTIYSYLDEIKGKRG